jgi:hypothetical protein
MPRSSRFTPEKQPGTYHAGGWEGLSERVMRKGNFLPPLEFDPWTVRPAASRYTDYGLNWMQQ